MDPTAQRWMKRPARMLCPAWMIRCAPARETASSGSRYVRVHLSLPTISNLAPGPERNPGRFVRQGSSGQVTANANLPSTGSASGLMLGTEQSKDLCWSAMCGYIKVTRIVQSGLPSCVFKTSAWFGLGVYSKATAVAGTLSPTSAEYQPWIGSVLPVSSEMRTLSGPEYSEGSFSRGPVGIR